MQNSQNEMWLMFISCTYTRFQFVRKTNYLADVQVFTDRDETRNHFVRWVDWIITFWLSCMHFEVHLEVALCVKRTTKDEPYACMPFRSMTKLNERLVPGKKKQKIPAKGYNNKVERTEIIYIV